MIKSAITSGTGWCICVLITTFLGAISCLAIAIYCDHNLLLAYFWFINIM